MVPDFYYGGRKVKDQIRTFPSTKDSLGYVRFADRKHGGLWVFEHAALGDTWLKNVCKEFCIVAEGMEHEWARQRVNVVVVMDGSTDANVYI